MKQIKIRIQKRITTCQERVTRLFCLEHCIIAMCTRKSAILENNNDGGK